MKPSPILLCVFISLSFIAQSQKTSFIEYKVGASIPVADYANKDAYNSAAGLAKTGPQLTVSYFKPLKKAGLIVQADVQYNPIETAALKNIYATGRQHNWQFNKPGWLLTSLRTGPFIIIGSPSDIFSGLLAATIGGLWAKSPHVKASSENGNDRAQAEFTSVSAFGLAYGANATINRRLNTKLSLSVSAGYFATGKPTFKNLRQSFSEVYYINNLPNSTSFTATTQALQKIITLTFSFGLHVAL